MKSPLALNSLKHEASQVAKKSVLSPRQIESEQTSLLEQLAKASLEHRDVERRSLWMELTERTVASRLERPMTTDPHVLALAASSAEMLAEQQGCAPPSWTSDIGPISDGPIYLDHRATVAGYRRMAEQSPPALRKRGFYAPAKYCSLT